MLHYPERAPIDSYGNGGFRFAHLSHRGSLLVLPSGMYGWPVSDMSSATAEDLELLIAETGRFDWLLLGTGLEMQRPPRRLAEYLTAKSISFEYMATSAAVRTYNVVLGEQRRVAAALIAVGAGA